jgi:hypothetical protein
LRLKKIETIIKRIMLHWLTRWRYLYISSNQTLLCLTAFIYEIESEPNEETLHGWIKLALSNHGSYTNWKLKSEWSHLI